MVSRFELGWGQIAQRRMDALALVHVIQEVPDLRIGVGEVTILCERHLRFFDRAHQPLGIAILPGLALLRQADPRAELFQARYIGSRGILHTLVRVMDAGLTPGDETPLQGGERERLVEMTAQLPAADGPRVDVHEYGEIDKVALEAHIGDVRHPHRIWLGDDEIGDQSGLAGIGMVTVGSTAAPCGRMPRQP
jgi:hypothetical protein